MTGYDELLKKGKDSVRNIILAVFACVIFLGSSLMTMTDIAPKAPGGMPAIAAIGLIFSVALGIYAIQQIGKK